jgi:hypothetical protein
MISEIPGTIGRPSSPPTKTLTNFNPRMTWWRTNKGMEKKWSHKSHLPPIRATLTNSPFQTLHLKSSYQISLKDAAPGRRSMSTTVDDVEGPISHQLFPPPLFAI